MKSSVRGRRGRLKWVGQPVPAPQSQTRSRSPSGRQKHYRAVELVGTGEVVFVDDVVEVSEQQKKSSATSSGPSSNEPHQHQPRLAQVGVCLSQEQGIYNTKRTVSTYPPDIPCSFLDRDLKMHENTYGSPLRTSISLTSSARIRRISRGSEESDGEQAYCTSMVSSLPSIL